MRKFTIPRGGFRRLIAGVCFVFTMAPALVHSQVSVTSTGGTTTATYTTLGGAFTAINAGTHTGVIDIDITASTSEGTTPAVLLASGQSSASYTAVNIRPSATATISGNPATARGVIELEGADFVTIDGDIIGGGVNRDLTIQNTAASATTNTVVIRLIGLTTAGLGAENNTIKNCVIVGSNSTTTSTFGIYSAGATVSTTGSGANNNNTIIENNHVKKAYRAIYARGTTTNNHSNLVISKNLIGSTTSTEYVVFRGIFLQECEYALIEENEIFNLISSTTVSIAGIEVTGSNVTLNDSITIRRNNIHDILNNGTSGGAYGITLDARNAIVDNNVIHGIKAPNQAISTSSAAIGIRMTGGDGHQVYYNSVHLYHNLNTGTGAGFSTALLISSATVEFITIMNNIFSNQSTSTSSTATFSAVYFISSYDFSEVDLDHNAYFVPAGAGYHVGMLSSTPYTTLTNWRAVSQISNPSNDVNSVPAINMAAPFTSNTNLTIPNGTSTPVESGGAVIAALGIPNADYTGVARPAGTGSNPDMGAYEFEGVLGDFLPPVVNSMVISPAADQCVAVPHTVTANIFDSSGVAYANLHYAFNGVSQTPIAMTYSGGGNWSAAIPAAGNAIVTYYVVAGDSAVPSYYGPGAVQNYSDEPVSVSLGPDQIVCPGGSTILYAETALPVKFTEIVQFKTGTGATPTYPAYATGGDLVEFMNHGSQSINISGWKYEIFGVGARTYTFPNGVIIPAGGLLILHNGPGVDDPSNNYYNTGGASEAISSTSQSGYVLSIPGGMIVDAVATNGYNFPVASGVTSADWSGSIPSSSAGVSRLTSDNNSASDWTISSASNVMTFGSVNPGVVNEPSKSFSWTNSSSTTFQAAISPTVTTTYIVTVSDGVCTAKDTILVTVPPVTPAPTTINDTLCGPGSATLGASGGGTLSWYNSPTGGSPLGTGTSYTASFNGADTLYVENVENTCPSVRTPVMVVDTAAPLMLSQSSTGICGTTGTINLSVSSSNTAYTYTWTGAGLSGTTGSAVTASPTQTTTYTVTGSDGTCSAVKTFVLTVSQPSVPSLPADFSICQGDSALLSANPSLFPIKITEVVQFKTGTGATPTYPSFATGADLSEITNSGDAPTSLAGWTWEIHGVGARTYTFPSNAVIPAFSVMILHHGSGTDDPANVYFNTGGSNDAISSTSQSGYILKNASGAIIDAVATNGYTFAASTGVTSADWSGNIPNSSAGVSRNGPDNNVAADWNISSTTTPMTVGAINSGIPMETSPTFVWSPASINGIAGYVTPTTTTQYIVTVHNGTCQASDTINITVNPTPAAPVTTNTQICGTSIATLSATGTGTINWYATMTSTALLGSGNTYSAIFGGQDTIYASAFDGTCEGPRSQAIIQYQPAAPVGVSFSEDSVCAGSPLVLTATSSNAGYAYTWTGPLQGVVAGNNVSTTATQSGFITVSATDGFCNYVTGLPIYVYATPTFNATTSDVEICEGDQVTLNNDYVSTFAGPIGTGAVQNTDQTYPAPYGNWYYGSRHQMLIKASELSAAGYVAGPITSLAFDVTAINGAGPDTNFTIGMGHTTANAITTWQTGISQVYTITSYAKVLGWNTHVFNTPFMWDGVSNVIVETCHNNVATYTFNASVNQSITPFTSTVYYREDNIGVCANTSVTGSFNQRPNILFGQPRGATYSWSPSGVSTPTMPSTLAQPLTTTTYTLSITDSVNGCVGTDTVMVTVNPLPSVDLGPDQSICANASHTFDAGAGFVSYNWSPGSTIQTQEVTSGGMVYVTVTDANGCSNMDSANVVILALPTVDLGNDTSICANDTLTLDAGAGQSSYLWNTPATTQTIDVSSSANYIVVVTNSDGCTNSDEIMVTVNPLPVVDLGSDVTTCNNSSVTLAAGAGFNSYLWSDGSVNSTLLISTWGMTSGTSNYWVVVTDGLGCEGSDTLTLTVDDCTGLNENGNGALVSIYPNPTQSQITVNFGSAVVSQIQLYGVDGKLLETRHIGGQSLSQAEFDLNSYAAGLYHVRVMTSEGMQDFKIIKY